MKKAITCMMFVCVSAGTVLAGEKETCVKGVQDFLGYVAGYGQGGTYQDAKQQAMSDAISFFGVQITSSGQLSEETSDGNSSTYLSSNIETRIDALVKGAVVLSTCEENEKFKLIVGLKKSTIISLLESSCKQRTDWVQMALKTLKTQKGQPTDSLVSQYKRSFQKALSDEKTDIEAWLLLQRPREFFPMIPEAMKQEFSNLTEKHPTKEQRYSIVARDKFAEKTLSMVVNKLNQNGIPLASKQQGDDNTTEIGWTCSIHQGSAIGNIVRFQGRCELSESTLGITPVEIDGISNQEDLENTVVRLVDEKLRFTGISH